VIEPGLRTGRCRVDAAADGCDQLVSMTDKGRTEAAELLWREAAATSSE